MSIYEYDEEKHMKAEREEHYALGFLNRATTRLSLKWGSRRRKPDTERRWL